MRKISQLSVLALFCALPFFASLGLTCISGTLFSLDFFGVPFADPASVLQIVGQGAFANLWPVGTALLGAGLSLLLAFFMGRVFCGWICPYGLFAQFVGRRRKAWKYSSRLKAGIFLVALVMGCLLGYPLISLLAMPGQISLAPMLAGRDREAFLLLLLPPFLALLLDLILGKRFFCSQICPQSILLASAARLLPKKIPGLRISWQKDKCACKEAACEKACQFALTPRKNPDRGACIMCGECVGECARKGGALNFTFKKI